MVRTQIQFTESQLEALRDLSNTTGRSVAELTRDAITMYLERRATPGQDVLITRAIEAAGQFASGRSDVSTDHDRHLAEAFSDDLR